MTKPWACALIVALSLTACGGGDDDAPSPEPTDAATEVGSSGPTVEDVLTCLTDAGLDAEEVSSGDTARIEVRYPNDTTKIDFRESAEDAEQDVEFGEAYDFEDFSIDAIYVLLGKGDEVALGDRSTIESCVS